MHRKLFVIGRLGNLPDGVRTAIEARRVASLTEADAAGAICPTRGGWTQRQWGRLRRAFQDYGLAVHGLWLDADGGSRRPPNPWPGSKWAWPATRCGVVWYQLSHDPKGYDP